MIVVIVMEEVDAFRNIASASISTFVLSPQGNSGAAAVEHIVFDSSATCNVFKGDFLLCVNSNRQQTAATRALAEENVSVTRSEANKAS